MAAGEDLGRGPEWGDDGLPEIHVEVPDDISELDREVQAYRREQRRERRRQLFERLVPGARRLGPYGVLAPVVAGALLVTAIFATLVGVLGPGGAPAAPYGTPEPVSSVTEEYAGEPLPDAEVTVDGAPVQLSDLRSAVVVSVPAGCGCTSRIDALTSTARASGIAVYLSGEPGAMRELADRSGSYPHVLDGARPLLAEHFAASGLTAVLVDAEGRVAGVVHDLASGEPLPTEQLRQLAATPSP